LIEVEGKKGVVEYFDSPTQKHRHTETVKLDTLSLVKIDEQTRMYFRDPKTKVWSAGRALVPVGEDYLIAFPNDRKEQLPSQHLFVRWDHPISDPSDLLAARITETPFFHDARSGFVRSLIEQRAVSAGMSGLLSSVIDLENHQIEVVRRVLQDPVQRYLLADEVGLGKTIEAGILIRQYVLDYPREHDVLILVPAHLVQQWRDELTVKFRLGEQLDSTIHILPHEDVKSMEVAGQTAKMLVIDEAHHVAALVDADRVSDRKRFERIRQIALKSERLLLLSATPLLHNEVAFQAMLHMLDPVIYRLGSMMAFRQRVQDWQQTAELFHVFTETEAGSFLETILDQMKRMFPADPHLKQMAKELQPHLEFDVDVEDPERIRLIRAIRTHVSETYRLHRRLLRNRRGNAQTETLLPGRVGLFVQEYDDPLAVTIEGALEQWRSAAAKAMTSKAGSTKAAHLADFFIVLTEASHDPEVLDAVLGLRLEKDVETARKIGISEADIATIKAAPAVPGEEKIFKALRKAMGGEHGDLRLKALHDWLQKTLNAPLDKKPPVKIVVFASQRVTADRIFARLHKAFHAGVERHQEDHEVWSRFLTDPACRILICDRQAEDGLNLQGARMYLVHYDLPFAPNRIEQRMGRLDRYGVGHAIRSFTFRDPKLAIAHAWVDCLVDAFLVFERSIASLQYLIDEEMRNLKTGLLFNGAQVIIDAAARLGGEQGKIEQELQQIHKLDEFDAIDISQTEEENFCDRLRGAEIDRKESWKNAATSWIVNQLRFGDWGIAGHDDPVRRFFFLRPKIGHQTLMPVSRLERNFFHVIDRNAEERFRPAIYPITFDRHTAQRRKVLIDELLPKGGKHAVAYPIALARNGDAFIDGLADYIHWDDRGVCFALWRFRTNISTGLPADLAFRFDFLIEADVAPGAAILAKNPHTTPEALRRQADQLFPPIICTIWLNDDLKIVTDTRRVALLQEPYRKIAPAKGRDYNVNHERWVKLEKEYPASTWNSLCQKARKTAEAVLRDQLQLRDLTEKLAARASHQAALRHAQLESRLTYIAAEQRKGEKAQLALDKKLSEALIEGILTPAIRLDAIGAVFVSKHDPFKEKS
jgi:ATP-dependent helicase HepA